jgi:hypothetical protein
MNKIQFFVEIWACGNNIVSISEDEQFTPKTLGLKFLVITSWLT